MPRPSRLSSDEITAALHGLPAWSGDGDGIHRTAELPGFRDAVDAIVRIADVAEEMDHHPDVDLRWRTVTFTLATHSSGGVTGLDLQLARQILAAAAEVAAVPVQPADRVEIALDCVDPVAVRRFWQAALGYREQPGEDGDVELQHPSGSGPSLWFQTMDPPRTGRGRFHLDVFVPLDQVQDRTRAALAAGGRLVSDAHAPSFWVLADPEGNEVCLCTRDDDRAASGGSPE